MYGYNCSVSLIVNYKLTNCTYSDHIRGCFLTCVGYLLQIISLLVKTGSTDKRMSPFTIYYNHIFLVSNSCYHCFYISQNEIALDQIW